MEMKHEILIYSKTRKRIPKKFIEDIILRALEFLKLKQPVEMAVLVVDKREIKRLNKVWRKKNETPDELSFGLNSRPPAGGLKFAKSNKDMLRLGEIVMNSACLSTGRKKISDKGHLKEILIHSLLHLLDYSHEKSTVQAKKMEKLEHKILKYVSR